MTVDSQRAHRIGATSIELELALQQPARPLVSPIEAQEYAEAVDLIARLVARLPEQVATEAVSERLLIVAAELTRRAA